jgi:hypothetical protein
MYVVKKKAMKSRDNYTNSELEILLDTLSPEIIKTFSDPPEFGSVSVKVVYHQSKPVRIECGRCINTKV